MDRMQIYKDIAQRTGGDIYLGVVGPVRTGKSTFIRRFMELLVMPNITDEFEAQRVLDELPQSGTGKTVMTTQPKFVPNEAVNFNLSSEDTPDISFSLRMVDCVGFMVPQALGQAEGEMPRQVRTPWFDYDIPFEEAAEIGTRKVMHDHSTVGIVVTTDGSITDIPRSAYIEAEERVIAEMSLQKKPFIILLNSKSPESDETLALRAALEEKHSVTVVCMDVLNMTAQEASSLIENMLMEFPIRTIHIATPSWMSALGYEHILNKTVIDTISGLLPGISRMKDYSLLPDVFQDVEPFMPIALKCVEAGSGTVTFELTPQDHVFYEVLSEECGYKIEDDYQLISTLKEFVSAKSAYDRLSDALNEVERTGYGLVPPRIDEMTLEKPEIVRQGNRFGVRLKANASGLHLIRVNVDSEIAPLVGTEEQSEELVKYLLDTFETEPEMIWQTNIFGKPLYDLVCDGMLGKVNQLPDEVRMKLRDAVQRIVNEGCNNLICVML